MVIGTAGAYFTKNAIDPPPAWNELFFYRYGYAKVTAVNAERLEWEWIDSDTDEVIDKMVIIKNSEDTVPTSSTTPTPNSDDDKDLDSGIIAAIVICSVLGVVFIGSVLYFRYFRYQQEALLPGFKTSLLAS